MVAPLTTSFNVGTELQSLVIRTASGVIINAQQIGHLEMLKYRQVVKRVSIEPCLYQGRRLHRNIYHDYEGEIIFDRFNGDPMNLLHNILQEFQSSGQETYVSIAALINNSGLNTQDNYIFNLAILGPFDGGDIGGMGSIKNTIPFICQTLTIAGSPTNVLTGGPSIPIS